MEESIGGIGMIYTFKVIETGEIVEHEMKLADYDQFKLDHPELERYIDCMPRVVQPMLQPPSDFSKYILGSIKNRVAGARRMDSNTATRIVREW